MPINWPHVPQAWPLSYHVNVCHPKSDLSVCHPDSGSLCPSLRPGTDVEILCEAALSLCQVWLMLAVE